MIDTFFKKKLDIIPMDEDFESPNKTKLDLVPMDHDEFEENQPEQDELLPLFSRERNGKTELTSYPEEFEQENDIEPISFNPIQQEEVQGQPQQEIEQETNKEFPLEGENDLDREIERNIAQQTSRQLEAIGGITGDLGSFAESITGIPLIGGLLGHFLPSSEDLKEVSEKASQGYTSPQNELEKSVGELQQDIANFMVPGSNQYSMLRNIGIPVVANLTKEGIKLTGSEKTASAAKIGIMIVLDIMSQRMGGAKKHIQNLFQEMEKHTPDGIKVNASKLEKDLNKTRLVQEKGGERPSTGKSLSKINEILGKKIENETIKLNELPALRVAINEAIDDLKGFEYIFKPKLKKQIISNLQDVKRDVINALEDYAKVNDPELYRLSRSANEAHAAYSKSNKIKEFLDKNFGSRALSKPVQILLGLGGAGTAIASKGALIGAVPLAGAYQSVKMISRLKNSPTLRKYYSSVLKSAEVGNVPQAARGIKAMEKELEEEDFE